MKIQTFSIVTGGSACNARCPFCISKMTPAEGITPKAPKVNWRNFHKAAALAKQCGVTTVMLTGKGEPTLYPEQITEYMMALNQHMFPLVELQTNGIAISKELGKYRDYLEEWYCLGLTTVCISVAHYASEENREIYLPHEEHYPGLTKLVIMLHDIGLSVRLSCVLANGYIDSAKEVQNLIEECKVLGIEQITLRPVNRPVSYEMRDDEMKEWFNKHNLSEYQYSAIELFLINGGRQIMKLIHGGVVYDYEGQNVCLSNSLTIDPNTEELRQLIFFPDGHLRYDWQYEGAILL
jgi:molybdenum cofactor biosynthesis enzyme MoaA